MELRTDRTRLSDGQHDPRERWRSEHRRGDHDNEQRERLLTQWAARDWKFPLNKNRTQAAAVEVGLMSCYATCVHRITSLWDNPYFSRVWTFQEMVIGNNPTMWSVSPAWITSIGDFETWMDVATHAHDQAEQLFSWISRSRQELSDTVIAVLAVLMLDVLRLTNLQAQVNGIAAARVDVSNGGSNWWMKNRNGISNIFSAVSFKPRGCKEVKDIFKSLLGIFHGLFSPDELQAQLETDDIDELTLAFFRQLTRRTGYAWTKLGVSSAEREQWDFIPTTPAMTSVLTTDCFAGVFCLGTLSSRNNHVHVDAITSLQGAPRTIMKLTFKVREAGSFRFSFRGCNCGRAVSTGTFKSRPIRVNDQIEDVNGAETGRVLVQCASILSYIFNPGENIIEYRKRLLEGLDPQWSTLDPKNKPPKWIDRCASGTDWDRPEQMAMVRVHNESMNFNFVNMEGCQSRLDNEHTRNIMCTVDVECGCQIIAPYSFIMQALTSVQGSSLGSKMYDVDEQKRIIVQDGLGLIQIGDDGRVFNLVAFGGDSRAHRAYASECRKTKLHKYVEARQPWPRGRALVREEFSHGLLDVARKYGYVPTGGSGNLLICRNNSVDLYRVIGVCIDEVIETAGDRGLSAEKIK